MHRNLSPASATLVLLAALIAVVVLVACERKPTAQPKVVTVAIREFKFEPATVTVHQGDTVEWENDDSVPHTAAADGQTKSLLSIPAACRREQRGATSQGRKARTTTPAHSTRT